MPSYASAPKDPDDTDDFTWNWASRLATGETISAFTATVVDGAWTVSQSTFTATTATARMTGGAAGSTCSVRGRITTSAGRQLDWTIFVPIVAQ